MTWEAVGALGEIIGAIAVVVSLIYLSIQIKHNSKQVTEQIKMLNASSFNAVENTFSRFRETIIRDPEVASLLRKSLESYEDLESDEKFRVGAIFQEWCYAWQNVFSRVHSGSFNNKEVEEFVANIGLIMNHPGSRQWWSQEKSQYSNEFIDLVEKNFLKNPKNPQNR